MSDTLIYRVAMASIAGMGVDLANKFLAVVGTEEQFLTMPQAELERISGSHNRMLTGAYRRERVEMAKREMEFITAHDIGMHYFRDGDGGYPRRLLGEADAPLMLYSKGRCRLDAAHTVAIVGTRHATAYGNHFVEQFVEELAQKLPDTLIVSGLAYGIDIAAHTACLRHNVPTAAVLAHGLNTIYPAAHRNAAADIVHSGSSALLTDYTSQQPIHKGNFVARNRIVAALCDCTVVAESAQRGGALITARLAAGYNRDVFALPGRASDEYSRGCNRLIRDCTASLITCADDFIKAMRWESDSVKAVQKQIFPVTTPQEDAVLDILRRNGEMHINSITRALRLPVYELITTLIDLESKGLAQAIPGSRYTIL